MDGLLIDSERVRRYARLMLTKIYTDVVNEILAPHGKEQTWEIKSRLMGKSERDATRAYYLYVSPSHTAVSFMATTDRGGRVARFQR